MFQCQCGLLKARASSVGTSWCTAFIRMVWLERFRSLRFPPRALRRPSLAAMASPTSRDAAVDYKGLGHKQAQPEARTSRKWYFVGAGLALLGVAGVATKVAHSGGAMFSSSATMGGTIQEAQTWEELPGIDKVIRKAQSLKQDKPLRNLQDLFYDSQPEELPWMLRSSIANIHLLGGLRLIGAYI